MRHPRLIMNSLLVLGLSVLTLLYPSEPASAHGTAVAVWHGTTCGVCFDPDPGFPACPEPEEMDYHCDNECGFDPAGECQDIEDFEEEGWLCLGEGDWESGWECGSGGT